MFSSIPWGEVSSWDCCAPLSMNGPIAEIICLIWKTTNLLVSLGMPSLGYIDRLLAAFQPQRDESAGTERETVSDTGRLLEELSRRERAILQLLAEDLQNKQIAAALNISLDTVKWHLKNLYGQGSVSPGATRRWRRLDKWASSIPSSMRGNFKRVGQGLDGTMTVASPTITLVSPTQQTVSSSTKFFSRDQLGNFGTRHHSIAPL